VRRPLCWSLAICCAFFGLADASENGMAPARSGEGLVVYKADAGLAALRPRLAIESPAPGAAVGESAPRIALIFSTPTGLPVDLTSLRFKHGGAPLEMRCAKLADGAECEPVAPFADGEIELEATVADIAGHESAPAAIRFAVDTAEPELVFFSPEEGFLSGRKTARVSGILSEAATLRLGDTPIEVGPGRTFEVEAELEEGANVLIFTATDAAGNATVAVLTGFADTRPPPPLAADQVTQFRHGAFVEIAGSPGAAEPDARVLWRNPKTGQEAESFARPDGSFAAALAAAETDLLVAQVFDPLDNASPPTDFALATADPEPLFDIAREAFAPMLSAPSVPESVAIDTVTTIWSAAASFQAFSADICTAESR
jgi:hypothetical protein